MFCVLGARPAAPLSVPSRKLERFELRPDGDPIISLVYLYVSVYEYTKYMNVYGSFRKTKKYSSALGYTSVNGSNGES